MSLCTWGRLGLGLGLGFFIIPFIVHHMAAQQLLDLVANTTTGECLGLGLGLRFFIVPFIVRHVATQQLLDLVANATAGPCFTVRVRVRVFHRTVYSAPRGNTTTVRFSCKCNCWPMF
jgi:hypothetical protein